MTKKITVLVLCLFALARAHAELRIPAFTAYLAPDLDGANVSAESGISDWNNPAVKVLWFGDIKTPGPLACALELRLPNDAESKLRLTVAGKSVEVTAKGAGNNLVKADFGAFDIPAAGYLQFTLESLNGMGKNAGEIKSLVLDGPAAVDAHFDLQPGRGRAAASVHLAYPVSGYTNIDAFYCEVTAQESPICSYFEACGWHRGYFGMQVNSPTERRIIFSVWDSGDERVDRGKVAATNRVTLIAKGKDVYAGDFGNEGTGGHSHLVYDWKTGEKQRFLVTAKPAGETATIYSGYWFHPEEKKWILISSWKAPKDGKYLGGLYSFIEDFNGDNGELRRKGLFGNQCFHTPDGQWHEETTAKFSCDENGKTDRFDRFMGVEDGQFFLSTGGFVPGFTKFGEKFTRPENGKLPVDFSWPDSNSVPVPAARIFPAPALKLGDIAPTITVAKWFKGAPVEKLDTNCVSVVEFWATWCPACRAAIPKLTDLAKKYGSSAQIMGVSIWEHETNQLKRLEIVGRFVDKMSDKMDYHVAADADDLFMAKNWMGAARQFGIPTAFVIGKDGRIEWIGDPENLDAILAQAVAGTLDPEVARAEFAERQKVMEQWADEHKQQAEAKAMQNKAVTD